MNQKVVGVFCALLCIACAGFSQEVERRESFTWFKPPAPEDPKAPQAPGGYIELGTGLNRLVDGVWVASEPQINVVANGVLASGAPHTLLLAPNLNTAGAVEVTDPQGNVIKSHVYGVAFYDPTTDDTVLIAELQDSFAEIIEPNQVIYRSVSPDIAADVRYTYTAAGLEQDFILKERPVPEDYGFSSETVQLVVLTEIVTKPQLFRAVIPGGTNEAGRVIGNNLYDEKLSLGNMRLGKGKAFLTHAHPQGRDLPSMRIREGAPVGKSRLQADNREFLVEAVNFSDIAAELEHLPEGNPVAQLPGKKKKLSTLIAKTMPVKPGSVEKVMVASAKAPERGLVIDYALLSSSSGVTLSGTNTYYINSDLILDNLTILPGTVVKFSTNGSITVQGGVFCPGNDYQPSIFTSKDDNSVGEPISGSTGNPSGYYAKTALFIDNNFAELRNLRIHHAKEGIRYGTDSFGPFLGAFAPHALWHSEILSSGIAIVAEKEVKLRNVLLYNNGTNFHKTTTSAVTAHGEHLTVHHGGVLNNSTNLTLKLTNSLVVSITTTGSYSGLSNVFLASSSGVFTNIGAGEHYLAANSPYRDAGSTNIHRVLKDDLAKRTTYSPVVFQNTVVTENLVLEPVVTRDVLHPDLGWHPPALDYLVKDVVITNVSLTLTNGVAVGTFGTNGFRIHGNDLRINGTPLKPSILTRYYCAQENRTNALGAYSPTNHAAIFSIWGSVKTDFAKITANANGGMHMAGSVFASIGVNNSEIRGGGIVIDDFDSEEVSINNSTFEGSYLYLSGLFTCALYNNHFKETQLRFGRQSDGIGSWPIKDNLFHSADVQNQEYPVDVDYNGFYLTSTNFPSFTLADNIQLAALFYEKGPLGDYYFPSNNALYRLGSRSASSAGLYHQTTMFDQTKATNGNVSMGRHYVSVDTSGYNVTAWVDDAIPGGASMYGDESWKWTNNPTSYAGSSNHQSSTASGTYQHYFEYATSTLPIYEGDTLFCYVLGGGNSAATEVMLQWKTTAWNHRAYWGLDSIEWRPSAHQGPLTPSTNLWQRLSVPASSLNVEGTSLTGMAFTLFNGKANWDYAGVLRYTGPPILYDTDVDGFADYFEDTDGDGTADTGETDWQSYNSLYGAGTGAGLQTFTPLQ